MYARVSAVRDMLDWLIGFIGVDPYEVLAVELFLDAFAVFAFVVW